MTLRFLCICFFMNTICFSQEEWNKNANSSLVKHQVGIGLSKFVNSAFPSDKNAYSLNYRYKLNDKYNIRAGAIYENDDSDGGFIDSGIKLGVDKNLKLYEKWSFFYGIDLMMNYTKYNNLNKNQKTFFNST